MLTRLIASSAALALIAGSALADPVADFYKGRTMTVVISGSTGSTYDVGTRLIVKYMSRYIPGQPQIVPKSMIGAGHLIATNYLYNAAERDGSVIGSIGETVPMAHLLTPQQAKFKAGEFFWLGNPAVTNTTIITWHTTGIRTLHDAAKREVVLGASGAGSPSSQVPQILNNVLGTKFKIINGFPATAIDVAMERGEVEARGGISFGRLKSFRRAWIEEKKVNLLVQIGLRTDAMFPDVPLLETYARNEAERRIFRFMSSSSMVGRPLVAPPRCAGGARRRIAPGLRPRHAGQGIPGRSGEAPARRRAGSGRRVAGAGRGDRPHARRRCGGDPGRACDRQVLQLQGRREGREALRRERTTRSSARPTIPAGEPRSSSNVRNRAVLSRYCH